MDVNEHPVLFKPFEISKIFKEINTYVHQGFIKLIKGDSKTFD